MEFGKPFGQGQSQACTLVPAAYRSACLLEGFEDPFQILFFQTDAGIRHRNIHNTFMVPEN